MPFDPLLDGFCVGRRFDRLLQRYLTPLHREEYQSAVSMATEVGPQRA